MRESANGKVVIGIDSMTLKEITNYIGQDDRHKDKFKDIVKLVLEGLHNRHLYKREKLSSDINNVTAMRFFVGQENDRIYCQETSYKNKKVKIIILGKLHLHKPNNDLSDYEISLIKELSKYEYEIEEDQRERLEKKV